MILIMFYIINVNGIFSNSVLNNMHCMQIGLVDVLRAVGIEPDGIVGHSVGELGCAYVDGCFTAEQMVLAAYYSGRASLETEIIKGLMAEVGKFPDVINRNFVVLP
jgi:malonyl CoA-acyl carrier protein transacylase